MTNRSWKECLHYFSEGNESRQRAVEQLLALVNRHQDMQQVLTNATDVKNLQELSIATHGNEELLRM